MGTAHVHRSVVVNAPIAHVFDRISDHEAMGRWPGVAYCKLVREGTPRNGVGAVREIRAGGLTLREEVLVFEPPARMEYTIVKGLRVDHRGTITLVAEGERTRLTWDVRLTSRVPLFARTIAFALGLGLRRAIPFFVRETEASAPQPAQRAR
jgi:hypothetical protein